MIGVTSDADNVSEMFEYLQSKQLYKLESNVCGDRARIIRKGNFSHKIRRIHSIRMVIDNVLVGIFGFVFIKMNICSLFIVSHVVVGVSNQKSAAT